MDKEKIKKLRKETVPIEIFNNRKLGVLECLVKYMRERLKLRNCEIAKVLSRDDRTIWTVYHRVKQKLK